MNKLKDFLYDTSDLLLAFLVLLMLCVSFFFTISPFFANLFFDEMTPVSPLVEKNVNIKQEGMIKPSSQEEETVEPSSQEEETVEPSSQEEEIVENTTAVPLEIQ